jgi:hypothetical protein
MFPNSSGTSASRVNEDGYHRTLIRAIKGVNFLAKQLCGSHRTFAYKLKAELCSELIIEGVVQVVGLRVNGLLSLYIHSGVCSARVHIPISHLCLAAQTIARQMANQAPAVAPLRDFVKRNGDHS